MNILLFGAPGAGKGTQSALLVEKLNYFQISTGDLFRANIKSKTALGQQAQSYIDRGVLVPDSVTIGMVDEALANLNGKSFILDGFPRNVAQAEALGKILGQRHLNLAKAIFLEVPSEALLSRLTGRRVCKSCGAVYHVSSKPPRLPDVCDVCGGEVVQRNDDKEEVIATRLKTYEESTAPLKQYYTAAGKLVSVDGDRRADEVLNSIKVELGQEK
jgi:adenylate kinase